MPRAASRGEARGATPSSPVIAIKRTKRHFTSSRPEKFGGGEGEKQKRREGTCNYSSVSRPGQTLLVDEWSAAQGQREQHDQEKNSERLLSKMGIMGVAGWRSLVIGGAGPLGNGGR